MPKVLYGITFAAFLLTKGLQAQTIAYDIPAQTGNQPWTGNLGLDFDVNQPIVVTSLGVFDSNGDGVAGAISVAIFDRNTLAQVTSTVIVTGLGGTLINGSRFMPLAPPVLLTPGNYSVVAIGFSAADPNGNSNIGPILALTENTGGGLISFVGSGRYDPNLVIDFPATVPPGLPTNAFNAGTFQFSMAGPPYSFQISYAANVASVDSYINLTNTGTEGGLDPDGNICANMYVFDPAQELIACCTCGLTPFHLKTFSVKNDLISNTLTPGTPSAISVALVGSKGPDCNAATVKMTDLVPAARAWMTTPHALPSSPGTYTLGETVFQTSKLNEGMLTKMTTYCSYIQANGSGYGICKPCKQGAQGPVRR